MNYGLKTIIRKCVYKFKFLESLYKKASDRKSKNEMKYDDATFFKRRYKENTGKELNLENPQTYNEKILWLQIHDRNPLYTLVSDKYLVKQWVADKIGEEYVVPLLGVWDSADDIPFDELPDEYVLKCNHDCGSVFVKRKGETLDIPKVKKRIKHALGRNYYHAGRVWGYKNIPPKVFAEEYIKSMDQGFPIDYKIFCFDGEPKYTYCVSERELNDPKLDFYDLEWKHMPIFHRYPNSKKGVPKPKRWEEMLDIARKLSAGFPHVRVDLYEEPDGKILFGEMTLCTSSGTVNYEPTEYEYKFGEYLNIEQIKDSPYYKE